MSRSVVRSAYEPGPAFRLRALRCPLPREERPLVFLFVAWENILGRGANPTQGPAFHPVWSGFNAPTENALYIKRVKFVFFVKVKTRSTTNGTKIIGHQLYKALVYRRNTFLLRTATSEQPVHTTSELYHSTYRSMHCA